MAVALGTGLTITFDTGFFAEIVDCNWSGIQRDSIRTSHMGTSAAHTFTPALLFDAGELEVEIHFQQATRPPIDDPAASCTVDFGPNTWAASAFMTEFAIKAPFEDKMVATGKLKFSGNITIT